MSEHSIPPAGAGVRGIPPLLGISHARRGESEELQHLMAMIGTYVNSKAINRDQVLGKLQGSYAFFNYNMTTMKLDPVHVDPNQPDQFATLKRDTFVAHDKQSGKHLVANRDPQVHEKILQHARKTNPKAEVVVVDSKDMDDLIGKLQIAFPSGQQLPKTKAVGVATKVFGTQQPPVQKEARKAQQLDTEPSKLTNDALKAEHQKVKGDLAAIKQDQRNVAAARDRASETESEAEKARIKEKIDRKQALEAEMRKRNIHIH